MVGIIEEGLCESLSSLGDYSHVEHDVTWTAIPHIPSAFANGVWRARLGTNFDIDARIDQILEPFRSYKVSLTWYVTPLSTPSNLGDLLVSHGLRFEGEQPGMVIGTGEIPELSLPRGLTIQRVKNKLMFGQWMKVFSKVFDVPAEASIKISQYIDLTGFGEDANKQYYNGALGDRIVGTSVVSFTSKSVVIAGISVLDEFRGRGIGKALTLHPLVLGRQMGKKFGVLSSTDMGYPVYQKLGFKEYFKIKNYVGDFS